MIEMINQATCVRCHLCVEACPCDVLRVNYMESADSNVMISYPEDCMTCQLCVEVCQAADSQSPSGKPIFVGPYRAFWVVFPWA